MTGVLTVVLATIAIITLSAFFVAVEFALLGVKRHRLEAAAGKSRAARAALRSSTELTVLLAGAQLGITVCVLALGAITKPAVHYWLTPAFESLGAPLWAADVVGFILALFIVTFLHLVIGEMMPKSWAIAHPETAAIMLSIPMRAFMLVTRPLLVSLNEMANWCLRRVGVQPVAMISTGQNADDLRHLIEHSVNVGAIELVFSAQLANALDLRRLTVADLIAEHSGPVSVGHDATVADVQAAVEQSGHLRILVRSAGEGHDLSHVVHVRDTLLQAGDAPVAGLTRPALQFEGSTLLHTALAEMRESRSHIAVVRGDGGVLGVITLADVLASIFPETVASSPAPIGHGRS